MLRDLPADRARDRELEPVGDRAGEELLERAPAGLGLSEPELELVHAARGLLLLPLEAPVRSLEHEPSPYFGVVKSYTQP